MWRGRTESIAVQLFTIPIARIGTANFPWRTVGFPTQRASSHQLVHNSFTKTSLLKGKKLIFLDGCHTDNTHPCCSVKNCHSTAVAKCWVGFATSKGGARQLLHAGGRVHQSRSLKKECRCKENGIRGKTQAAGRPSVLTRKILCSPK